MAAICFVWLIWFFFLFFLFFHSVVVYLTLRQYRSSASASSSFSGTPKCSSEAHHHLLEPHSTQVSCFWRWSLATSGVAVQTLVELSGGDRCVLPVHQIVRRFGAGLAAFFPSIFFPVPPSATSTSTPDFAFVQIFARRIYLLLLLLLLFLLLHRSLRGMCLTATCTTTSLFTL